ncbi:hypothetical protein SARC_01478 [Sphaeroforma arctica JP610]|uniref:ADF-H domain-containing protein n=1 Tax=Sphaeroforma arctica JP610 TaxID=667725 RepID=A0A0L0GDP5_9EUKA|nr:hypothetical protein SARC_01478 [Sphaeroforma arctica JP610]KNC86383.1 hypothetical protein SARC_01478 [Sphaeroforma arctica JP610]|eukprot:XP_014160285.1 hypothetical protein SARC_01478 [Sphaeroforma arctica JP610]
MPHLNNNNTNSNLLLTASLPLHPIWHSVFIYSCPGFNCPIKERMLYASCKNEVISIAVDCGVTATHKMEVSDGSELTHEALHTEVHPPVVEATKRIVKPKGPGRSKTRPTRATE